MALEDLADRYAEMKAQIAEMNAALAEMRFTGQSEDEMVTVTVTASGHLSGVEINPRVFRRPDSEGLAESIMTATTRAREQASEKSTDLLQSVLGTSVTADDLASGSSTESMIQAVGRRIRDGMEGDR